MAEQDRLAKEKEFKKEQHELQRRVMRQAEQEQSKKKEKIDNVENLKR